MPNRAFDAERADRLARFQAAFLFGPLHVARHTGHADEASKGRTSLEYEAFCNAMTHPYNMQNRPHRVGFHAREGNTSVVLVPRFRQPGVPASPSFSRTFSTERKRHSEARLCWYRCSDTLPGTGTRRKSFGRPGKSSRPRTPFLRTGGAGESQETLEASERRSADGRSSKAAKLLALPTRDATVMDRGKFMQIMPRWLLCGYSKRPTTLIPLHIKSTTLIDWRPSSHARRWSQPSSALSTGLL